MKRLLVLILLTWVTIGARGQKLIEYTSGMGTRSPERGSVWILYEGVEAVHEGMILNADSAHYDTEENSFTAFRNVKITLSDTTFIYGDRLFYDGNSRVIDIWADTVNLIDGGNTLKADHLTYERDRETAYYRKWGHGTSDERTLYSRQGEYHADSKVFCIMKDVCLTNKDMKLFTDTLIYTSDDKMAHFHSSTRIYSDSSMIYSEEGTYNTDTRYASSYRASHVENGGKTMDSDTLYYDELLEFGRAYGDVRIKDSANDVSCTGKYGETDRKRGYSYVTDSARVLMVDKGDSLYMHGDTVFVYTDDSNHLQGVRANYHVKTYRKDAQGMCDSVYYRAEDSTMLMYGGPVVWYEHYQCSADTIEMIHDTAGLKMVYLRSNFFAIQQVDILKFNQLKGKQGEVYFTEGEPQYVDILHNAEMVYYITEEGTGGEIQLVGVNVGRGSKMRIYFDSTREASRVVTYENPDMETYPVMKLPEDKQRLIGFRWQTARRPKRMEDIYVW